MVVRIVQRSERASKPDTQPDLRGIVATALANRSVRHLLWWPPPTRSVSALTIWTNPMPWKRPFGGDRAAILGLWFWGGFTVLAGLVLVFVVFLVLRNEVLLDVHHDRASV
jgi:hypothetical protein